MLSTTREKWDKNSDDAEGIATKKDVGKKKAVFELQGVLLHYTGEVTDNMSTNFSQKPHQV